MLELIGQLRAAVLEAFVNLALVQYTIAAFQNRAPNVELGILALLPTRRTLVPPYLAVVSLPEIYFGVCQVLMYSEKGEPNT